MKKVLIGIIAVLLLVVLIMRGVPFLINLYLNDNADRIVSGMITRTSGFGGHEVTFGSIKLDYNYSGTFLLIEDIAVRPTESIDDRKVKIRLDAGRLNITGFRWSSFLLANTIAVDSAVLENVAIISSVPPFDSIFNESKPKNPPKKESRDYDLITVGHFQLNNFSVEAKNNLNDSLRISLFNLTVESEGFELTKEDLESPTALFQVKNIHGNIDKIELHFDEYRQYVIAQDIAVDTKAGTMKFGEFDLLHKFDKYVYTGQFENRQSYITIQDATLEMSGINFDSYFQKGIVELDTLISRGLKMEVFIDKRKADDMSKRPPMVHQAIKNLEQVIHIQNSIIENGYIKIEERPDNNAPVSGFIFFSELNAHITNISNYHDRRGDNHLLEMEASAKLMDVGPVNVHVSHSLESTEGQFRLKGTLGSMPVTLLNQMIEPEAKISLKSGVINRLDFNIAGNEYEGDGELIVRYDNLELELLNKDFESDRNILRKIGSFVANKIIIKSNNPGNNGNLRKGQVYFKREPHKSMFFYWWKLIFSGLKSTVTGENLEAMKKKDLTPKIVNSTETALTDKQKRREKRKQKKSE